MFTLFFIKGKGQTSYPKRKNRFPGQNLGVQQTPSWQEEALKSIKVGATLVGLFFFFLGWNPTQF